MRDQIVLDIDYYLEKGIECLLSMSRTSKGVINTKSTKKKGDIFVNLERDPEEIASLVQNNFTHLIKFLWENRNNNFTHTNELDLFLRQCFGTINHEIVKPEFYLRFGENKHDRIAPYTDVPNLYQQFLSYLLQRLSQSTQANARKTASQIFYKICRDHYFADSCGKMCLSTTMLLFMRHNLPLVNIKSKDNVSVNTTYQPYIYEDLTPNSEYLNHYQIWESIYISLDTY